MRGCLRGCLGALAVGIAVTGIAYGGWRWGPAVFPGLERALGIGRVTLETGPTPSPELAEATLDRFEAFRDGDPGRRERFGGAELTSVARFALPGIVPPGVEEATVELRDGEVRLSARVAVRGYPDLVSLDEVVGLLPDTVRIVIRGVLVPFGSDRLAMRVERVEAAHIPLPARTVPGILRALGRTDEEGLPRDALLVPLPRGVGSVYVDGDQLVLVSGR